MRPPSYDPRLFVPCCIICVQRRTETHRAVFLHALGRQVATAPFVRVREPPIAAISEKCASFNCDAPMGLSGDEIPRPRGRAARAPARQPIPANAIAKEEDA